MVLPSLFCMTINDCTVLGRDEGFVERTLSRGDAEALEVLEEIWGNLVDITAEGRRPTSWKDCVTWARCKWETLYNSDICQLLHCFPPDQVKTQRILASSDLFSISQRAIVVHLRDLVCHQLKTALWLKYYRTVSFFTFLFSHLYSHFLPGLRGLIFLV